MSKEEKEEEKLGRLATDIAATDGVQVSRYIVYCTLYKCKLYTVQCTLLYTARLSDGAGVGYGFKRIQAHKSGPYDFENIQFGQVSYFTTYLLPPTSHLPGPLRPPPGRHLVHEILPQRLAASYCRPGGN